MRKNLPVLNIDNFRHFSRDHDFYTERLLPHIQQHDFTNKQHKHDFFLMVLFTQGSGTHEIDFVNYEIKPGAVFFLNPGQSHHWKLSKNIDGLIFFHTREFFDKGFTKLILKDFPFFNSIYNSPFLMLRGTQLSKIKNLFEEIKKEYHEEQLLKTQKILSLVCVLYVELSRLYQPGLQLKSESYLSKLRVFEDLIERHFKEIKFPSQYAGMMNITERHLNRISKSSLNKTSSELILDRVILEAKRLLMNRDNSISQVSELLGYTDNSYFSRLFKKNTGLTPKKFMLSYK